MAHDVFISYSSKDKAVADAACATLEAKRIRCWIAPRDAQGGVPYAESIIDAINESRVMILVLSSNANGSPQVMREVERAASAGAAVIPFRIEDIVPSKSLQYFIGPVHWLDALTPPLEQHLERLAETVRLLLERLAPGASRAPGAQQPAAASPSLPEAPPKVSPGHPTPGARPGLRQVGVLAALAAVILFGVYEGIFARHTANRSEPTLSVSQNPIGSPITPAAPPADEMNAYKATHTLISPSAYLGLWDATMGPYRCRQQTFSDGRYRFFQSCPPPLANEAGVLMMATDGTWRLWADTGRRDQGYFRSLGPDRIEAAGLLGSAVWVRVGAR